MLVALLIHGYRQNLNSGKLYQILDSQKFKTILKQNEIRRNFFILCWRISCVTWKNKDILNVTEVLSSKNKVSLNVSSLVKLGVANFLKDPKGPETKISRKFRQSLTGGFEGWSNKTPI